MLKTTPQTRSTNKRLFPFLLLLVILSGILFAYCTKSSSGTDKTAVQTETSTPSPTATPSPEPVEIFTKSNIPDDIRQAMYGVTISDRSPVSFDQLAYLTVTYYGYDDLSHQGHMVVDAALADEVLIIFKELYEAKFPIEKMKLPYEYDGIDELSMQDNNTSAFNDRPIEGSGGLSYHQLGRAVDINPLVNPYIRFSDGVFLPTTAQQYVNREQDVKGMIKADSICVQIFKKYGWTWGGDWNSLKDYQHFEKK